MIVHPSCSRCVSPAFPSCFLPIMEIDTYLQVILFQGIPFLRNIIRFAVYRFDVPWLARRRNPSFSSVSLACEATMRN